MFLFLKAAKNQRVSAKLRQSKTLPWRLKAKGERPVIGIKLSQSYHPTLAAKQAQGRGGEGPKQQTALQQLLCVLSCSVDHSGCSLLALDKKKGPDWLIYQVWNEVLFQERKSRWELLLTFYRTFTEILKEMKQVQKSWYQKMFFPSWLLFFLKLKFFTLN